MYSKTTASVLWSGVTDTHDIEGAIASSDSSPARCRQVPGGTILCRADADSCWWTPPVRLLGDVLARASFRGVSSERGRRASRAICCASAAAALAHLTPRSPTSSPTHLISWAFWA